MTSEKIKVRRLEVSPQVLDNIVHDIDVYTRPHSYDECIIECHDEPEFIAHLQKHLPEGTEIPVGGYLIIYV